MSRECGDCQLCCEVFGVEELNKGPLVKCKHQSDTGCVIHPTRPPECRNYQCLWKSDESIPEAQRPDKIGVVIERRNTIIGPSIAVHQQQEDQWRQEPLWTILQHLCEDYKCWLYAVHLANRQTIFPSWSNDAKTAFDDLVIDNQVPDMLGDLEHVDE